MSRRPRSATSSRRRPRTCPRAPTPSRCTRCRRPGWAASPGQGYFQDLSSLVPTYPGLQWDDVVPVMQSNSSFGGKIYAIPFDSDVLSVYYRTDILGADGVAPPKTWDEYLTVAKKYQGKDLNGDGTPDYGSCIEKAKGGVGTWQFNGVFSGFVQALGTKQGTFFGDNMTPLVNNEAMGAALDFWKASSEFGPPAEINLDQGTGRGLMTSGRCALNIDWGDMGTLPLDAATSKVKNKVGAVVMPGSHQGPRPRQRQARRLRRHALPECRRRHQPRAVQRVRRLDRCDQRQRPTRRPRRRHSTTWPTCPRPSSPTRTSPRASPASSRSGSRSRIPPCGSTPGMTPDVAKNFLDTYIGASLNGPNAALDLRIPQANQYTNVLEDAGDRAVPGRRADQGRGDAADLRRLAAADRPDRPRRTGHRHMPQASVPSRAPHRARPRARPPRRRARSRATRDRRARPTSGAIRALARNAFLWPTLLVVLLLAIFPLIASLGPGPVEPPARPGRVSDQVHRADELQQPVLRRRPEPLPGSVPDRRPSSAGSSSSAARRSPSWAFARYLRGRSVNPARDRRPGGSAQWRSSHCCGWSPIRLLGRGRSPGNARR